MAKRKEGEEEGKEGGRTGEEKPDDLEIISIGSLYTGPWDKKYWSSSRGKDRYPYPVGYQARRAYNGSTYKMEILEGPKGPLFVICSADGHSSSGQTPDIAWEKFQKKGCPRMSIWHGKRFTCRIDGIEFFGFKNPFIQRLLRELVATINGVAERSLLSSSDGTSRVEHNDQQNNACSHLDLLTFLERVEVTRKRSKRHRLLNSKSTSIAGFKRLRPGNPSYNAEASKIRNRKQSTSLPNPIGGFNENDNDGLVGALSGKSVLISVSQEGNDHKSTKDCLQSLDISDHLREGVVHAHGETMLVSSEICKTRDDLSTEEKPLDRSQDTEDEGLTFQSGDDKTGNAPSKEPQGIHRVDLYAPDTLDFLQDSIADSPPTPLDKGACANEHMIANDVVFSEGLVPEFHQEEIARDSNSISEKSDFDLLGQEIAKSMMTVLLPQAIPLLKTISRKKINTVCCSEKPHSAVEPHEENKTGDLLEAQVPGVDHSSVPSSEHSICIIPDSYDDLCENATSAQILSYEKASAKSTKDGCPHYSFEQVDDANIKKLSICHVEPSGSKDISHLDEVKLGLNKNSQDVNLYLTESISRSTSTSKKDFQKENQNVGNCFNEALIAKMHTEERDLRSAPKYNKAPNDASLRGMESSVQYLKDNMVKVGATESGSQSINPVPKKVYARKKTLKTASGSQKCNALITTHSGDLCVPETTGALLDLETSQIISSAEYDSKARIGGQTNDAEKPQGHCENMLVERRKDPLSAENQGTVLCHDSTSSDNKFQVNLDMKLRRNVEIHNELEGTVRIIGCYFHSFPVSSLLLIMKGNKIYVCVLCGLLGDKERTLFLYELLDEELGMGCPSFVKHTSVVLPSSTDIYGREIVLERSGLQLTPDGHCLVLLGSMKTPYCREGRIDCLCSACASECVEHSTLKIVQVKAGYVSLLVKLRTTDSLQCVLVCEPYYIVAAGESGSLHLWKMDSTWSEIKEKVTISTKDFISPCILELKKIQNCAPLIVGHNGFGEFTVWDISKCRFMSRFSSPGTSVYQIFPISSFSWQKEAHYYEYSNVEEHINRLMDCARRMWSSELIEDSSYTQTEGEDIAIWLVVSAISDSDAQWDYMSSDTQVNPVGWWRLGLLVKNMLILGGAFDPRATAIGTSGGRGIAGTLDGDLYMWNLLTGSRLGTLHQFKGGGVSCIATDHSSSGILAVADDTGQLLVYRCLSS